MTEANSEPVSAIGTRESRGVQGAGAAPSTRASSQSEQQGGRGDSMSPPATKIESDRLFKRFQRAYQDHVAAKESWEGQYECAVDCSYCREFRVVAEWRAAWENRV